MKMKFSLIAAFVSLSFLLTACSMGISNVVNEDGSASFGVAFKFTQDDIAQFGSYGFNITAGHTLRRFGIAGIHHHGYAIGTGAARG